MNEDEFDAQTNWRPFGTADAARLVAQMGAHTRLLMTLGKALWGDSAEDVQRQLLAPHPEIPPGFEVEDFRQLLKVTERINSGLLTLQRLRGLPAALVPADAVVIGSERLSMWGARWVVIRRAVEYLES